MSQPSPYSDTAPSPRIKKALGITLNLMQRRDDMRSLLGERYDEAVLPFRHVVRGIAAKEGISLTDAGLGLAKTMDAAGHDTSLVFAAVVDECEARR